MIDFNFCEGSMIGPYTIFDVKRSETKIKLYVSGSPKLLEYFKKALSIKANIQQVEIMRYIVELEL